MLLSLLFVVILGATFFIDVFFINPRHRAVSVRRALLSTSVWMLSSLMYGLLIFYFLGKGLGLQFLTGYLVEQSLSVDNLFVFIVLFSYFAVDNANQHRILFWGIAGALVMRGLFIVAGVSLIRHFHATIYILGAFLIYTAFKLLVQKHQEGADLEKNIVLRLMKKHLPVTHQYDGDRFFTKISGRMMATPMLVVLVLIETTDIVFAVDSIPAILAISQDTLVIYTSNILAVMGLRSMFFALGGLLRYLQFLHQGLAVILLFIGLKMILEAWIKIPIELALGFVVIVLAISAGLSLLVKRNPKCH